MIFLALTLLSMPKRMHHLFMSSRRRYFNPVDASRLHLEAQHRITISPPSRNQEIHRGTSFDILKMRVKACERVPASTLTPPLNLSEESSKRYRNSEWDWLPHVKHVKASDRLSIPNGLREESS